MAKRSGPYKRYLEGDTGKIPRRTLYRWNLAKKRKEAGNLNEKNEDGGNSLQNMENNKEANQKNTTDNISSACNSEEEDGENQNSPTSFSDTYIQETIIEAEQNFTEDDEIIENSSTTTLLGTDIQLNEESFSDSTGDMLDATSSEDENTEDGEELECNASGENAFESTMASEDKEDANDKPLYPGAPLSKGESLLMLMSYLLRHNLTGEALTHLLEMFNVMFPGLIPSTHYLFHKEFGRSSTFEVHFYCELCSKYLGIRADCPFECDSCKTPFSEDANLKKGFYFLVLPLRAQIRQLLQEHGASINNDAKKFGILSDIQSGEEYKKLCDSGVLGKDDLTLIWNCDGAPVFKSSKYSIWPIQCQVIELHPDERKNHILMSALWFGPGKPSMCTFLKPFVKEVSLLETEGVDWQDTQGNQHNSKVFVLICSSDSVARPLLRNTKQFNGFHGCDFCYHKGGKTYPYDRPEPALRNERDHFNHAMSASVDEPVFGVKGPSPLMKLGHFQMINGFIPEYQHNVCLGVTRQLSTLWFDTANSEAPWYIGKQIKEVDLQLEKIKPPVEITRTPRSITERKFWKASEWRAFLLFYSLPTLKGILPVRFWNHFFLLVFSIYTLLQDKIKTESIMKAELALKKFVIEFQRLYGKNHMTFNIHLLTHVTQSVKNWGPLWATSTFPFESNMGTLLKYFHGTQYVPSQIARKFLMWRELPEKAKKTITSGNTKVQSFVEELYVCNRRTEKCEIHLNGSIKGFGHPPLQENIPASHWLAIVKLCGNLSNCFWYYRRFLVDGVLHHSQTYDRLKKRFNSAVLLKDGQLCLINNLVAFKEKCAHQNPLICACTKHCCVLVEELAKSSRLLCKDTQINVQSNFIYEVKKTGNLSAIWPTMITAKCVVVESADKLYITPLPNPHERD